MTNITNIKLIESDSDFLEKVANKITVHTDEWYYMPFWYRKVSKNTYQEVMFENLPQSIIQFIEKQRENND
jgi:hypothetical protein